MHVGRIINATRVLGAPYDWDKAKNGSCGSLPIQDIDTTAGRGMQSAWIPTPEEIERIVAGAPILLLIIGQGHPPVSMSVGRVPEAGA